MDIILYLLQLIQYQHKQICWLLNFICRHLPLRQWTFDDSHSQRYQKFKIDQLPVIKTFIKQDWQFLLEYYQWKYKKTLRPVQRRNGKSIPEDVICPVCGAPHHFIYDNNGGNGQYQCKVCGQTFTSGDFVTTPIRLMCPHCSHTLVPKKDRKFFRIHKCVNPKCPYYLHQLFLSSSPSVEYIQQFFCVPSRVASLCLRLKNICAFQGSTKLFFGLFFHRSFDTTRQSRTSPTIFP